MKKIIAILVLLVIGFSGVLMARRVVFKKLGRRNYRIFIKKCARESGYRRTKVRRALNRYQKYIGRYKRTRNRSSKRRYKKMTIRYYKLLRSYCRRTAVRMLRRRSY